METTTAITTEGREEYIAHDTTLGSLHNSWAAAEHQFNCAVTAQRKDPSDANAARLADARSIRDSVADTVREHESHYTGWSRYFLVTSSSGHVHSSLACSTCYWDTRYAALPELSGLTDADAVAAYGEILCSVCFPDAPVAWTNGVSKITQEARDERDAKRVAALGKKAAAALFPENPDKGIRAGYDTVRTISAAKSFLADAYESSLWYGKALDEAVTEVAAVLAERTETTPAAVLADAEVKAAKRVRKGLREAANSPLMNQPSITDEMRAEQAARNAETAARVEAILAR